MSRPPHRRRVRLLVGSGATAVVVGVAFVFARSALASGDTAGTYRTAVVTRAPVVESLQRSGTVEPVSQAAVAFPVAGKVASVSVHVGQAVATGDALATLDTTTLQSQVAQKKAALAQAQLTLDQAVTAANAAAAAAAAATTTTTTPPTTAPPAAARSAQPAATDAVNKVTQGQQDVDAALARAKDSMQFAISACSANGGQSPDAQHCAAAEQAALGDQETVAAAQKDLAASEATLAKSLQSAGAASAAPARSTASATATAKPATVSKPTTTTITPEQLVADQAGVDAAQADVNVIEQNLAQAAIVSPIAGTIAAVNLTPGTSVSAGSSTADVVVVGPGGFEVATTVDVNDMPKLKVGDPAKVTPDGGSDTIAGQVVAIGVLPATSGTTTTYPVIIGLDNPPASLHAGASATVSIDVSSADTAVTVPTSAVRAAGNLHVVSVLTNGKPVNTPVQVGSIGAERTEIVSGLDVGQVVVLADLSQPLPSSNTTPRFGGAGGFRGGGLGGGGFGGGGGVRIVRGG